jgi:hypothetical protein
MNPTSYLLSAEQPWVRYNTLLNLEKLEASNTRVLKIKAEMLENTKIQRLIEECKAWPGQPLRRHNDAGHPIHKLAILADFGLVIGDPGLNEIINRVLSHYSEDGSFQSLLEIPERYGGKGTPEMSWMLCDSPTLLYCLQKFQVNNHRVDKATEHLLSLVDNNGWRCRTSMGFRGPGRISDHCPYANLISVKALAMNDKLRDSEEVRVGVEAQLEHWANRCGRKIYLFGIGTTFRRLKYPHVWYDILHVLDVLSIIPYAKEDTRFLEMLYLINCKQLEDCSFKPESVFRAFKDWSFGQKKVSSPWITYKVALINSRLVK